MLSIQERACVWLSLVEGLGPRRIARLFGLCADAGTLMEAGPQDWEVAVGRQVALAMQQTLVRVEPMLERIERAGIRVITRQSEEYPPYLQEVYDPPHALYVRGSARINPPRMIGVVGSRRCTRYGLDMAKKFGRELAQEGICVVSGLARGVDTAAHQGALEAQGETIAVLGCGVDVVYPPENARLYEQIAQSGALVSEYLPGVAPLSSHFPLRNRIISGMSQGLVLVEAAKGSGAMITVDYALEHGREVFAVPGNVTAGQSAGTNQLIYDGKCMARGAQDVLFAMGWSSDAPQTPKTRIAVELSPDEAKVALAVQDEEHSFEELEFITGFDASRLNSLLTMLVMRGIMKQSPGRIFSLNR